MRNNYCELHSKLIAGNLTTNDINYLFISSNKKL